MRASAVTSIGDGVLWPLFDDEGSMSILFTRTIVPIEAWAEWAKNPATWRKRFPGERVGVTSPNEVESLEHVEQPVSNS
jgi:hypothetical protein